MKSVRLSLLAALFLASVVLPAAAAVPDPDRDSNTPTHWRRLKNQTADQLEAFRKDGRRLIDLEISAVDAGRFDAVLVDNAGVYQRSDGWWHGLTRDQVVAKTKEKNGRITDLEPYTVDGKRLFSFALIRNEGEAAKGWWWNYDLTPEQVKGDIDKHGMRLIDLDSYEVGGKTLYSYVGIKNRGVDAKAWWWYHGVGPDFVADRIDEHGARLIDVERNPSGNLSVIMVKNDGTSWWWGHGLSEDRLTEMVAVTGSRIVALEAYRADGENRYVFVGIDNADEETRRLRNLAYDVYEDPKFGERTIRGFLVKRVGGATLADLAGDLPFQPLSTLKLLPYLHAFVEVDKGDAQLGGTAVSWTAATEDDAGTDLNEPKDASCLTAGAPRTKAGSAKLEAALPTMMWESHNRTLDAFLDKYTPEKITARAQQLGLADTEMYYGCRHGDLPTWASNRTTLTDLAKLFEGVEKLQFVKKASTRRAFLDNMINLDYAGASYASPITGRTTGPLYNGSLRDIVKREAGPAKQGIVEEFMTHAVLRGKGGGGGPSGDEIGYSDFLYVTLPFREGTRIIPKTFVVGWFIYKLKSPPGCPDSEAWDGGPCQAIWHPEDLEKLKAELHTLPIRMALKTW